MKTYKKIVFFICLILALIGFYMMASFKTYNACEFATNNIELIRNQVHSALNSNDLEMIKFYSQKALTTLPKTKTLFTDCGCLVANKHLDLTASNLTYASESNLIPKSKEYLQIAYSNTILSIQLLKDFEKESESFYGDNVLEMNTQKAYKTKGEVVKPEGKLRQERINETIETYKASLNDVVNNVECEEAFSFISRVVNISKERLKDESLSETRRDYHKRIYEISLKALISLEGCKLEE
ncbi:hypothetical protein [Croceivirga lutea]|uniref:hypothetical protein n=1 Tax=Croceivirga lutea TaxID=1775167 RepID=UPI00163B5857|nr:hypothetical protein [Croceivirga lutea]